MSSTVDQLGTPELVRRALLEDDRAVRAQFAEHLGAELDRLASTLAECFERLPTLHARVAALRTQRSSLMDVLMFGVLDDIVISTKLLLGGKGTAAGNLMRQAIEGVAMSILCSADGAVVLDARSKKGDLLGEYWSLVMVDDPRVQAQRAIQQLTWNAELLAVDHSGLDELAAVAKHYSSLSHAGIMTILSRVPLNASGQPTVGGSFDPGKLDWYRRELDWRVRLSRQLPNVIEHLLGTLSPPTSAATNA
ncbi:hypothetical protein [Burkholderia ubonensis]|uniref:Uncharacterized protein n=1 Tax=Burkholderia ubonensis subsp. mesacidophila TaxID=265293 RepID=A0A2A4FC11_9BURK|nr:hypothetical protein [Burkholderia ubonensis]PCE30222.1 hypothetical protein BZL54_21250 [Burkholderia ubonensis subsp. mesacidophila]